MSIIDKNDYFSLLKQKEDTRKIDFLYARVVDIISDNPRLQFFGDLEPTDFVFQHVGVKDVYAIGDTVIVLQIGTKRFLQGVIRV